MANQAVTFPYFFRSYKEARDGVKASKMAPSAWMGYYFQFPKPGVECWLSA